MGACNQPAYLTPADVAKRLGLAKSDTVIAHIRAGRLRAIDVGTGRRACYRIDPAALAEFIAGQQVAPADKPMPRASRKRAVRVKHYF